MADSDELVAAAADRLYGAEPDGFLAARKNLAAAAKADGDMAAAKQIAALRKPTVAASVVNRLALHDDAAVDRLVELGGRLRRAHERLDAALLRELTTQRRSLIAELTSAAFTLCGSISPAVALREEVSGTFDAAVADPSIAARLGRLARSERWDGFGVAPLGTPELKLVRGGKATRSEPAAPETANMSKSAAAPALRRKLSQALDRAREAFDAAEDGLTAADGAEREASEAVRAVTAELADLQHRLEDAKRDLESARKAARAARSKRREARSALDRAERNAEAKT